MKRLFLLALIFLCASRVKAATYPAASCNLSAVQAAINAELATPVDGDIITIPAGTCTWTGSVSVTGAFTHSVTIQGAGAISATTGGASTTGTDQTIIIDNVFHGGGGANQNLSVTMIAGKSLRITGIAFYQNGLSTPANNGIVAVSGGSTSVRLDHLHFNMVAFSHELNITGVYGVADHNYFQATGGVGGLYFEFGGTDGFGDEAWNQADQWGTSNFFYVEDNLFDDHGNTDSHSGARYVFRHNTTIARQTHTPTMSNHGIHDRGRSSRAIEVYQNTWTSVIAPGNGGPTTSNNGGGELYWGNTINGYQRSFDVDYTCKDTATYGECGTNPPNGWGLCNLTTGTGWDQNATPPNGYECIDGPGLGQGDLLSGSFPNVCNITLNPACNVFTGQWPRQALSPIYLWNNAFTPASGYSSTPFVGSGGTTVNNRDYYQQFSAFANPGSFNGTSGVGSGLLSARPATCTARVGYWATDTNTLYVCNPTNTWTAYYVPFTYPHPLVNPPSGTLTFSPNPVAFSSQAINTTSSPLTVTVTNVSSSVETLSTPYFTLSGVNSTEFSNAGTGTCGNGGTVAVGSSCTVNLTFTPTGGGTRNAVLTINGTVSGSVSISGTGLAPAVSLNPTNIAFGNQNTGTSSPNRLVTLTNNGAAILHITSILLTGANAAEFSQNSSTCGATLAINASCTLNLVFSPITASAKTANLTFTTDAGTSPNQLPLTGTGQTPITVTITILPNPVAFGNQVQSTTSLAQTVTVTSTGSGNEVLNTPFFTITGTNAADFARSGGTCTNGQSLAPAASCTILLTFTPTNLTAETATLNISGTVSGNVSLTGSGVAPTTTPAPAPVLFVSATPIQPTLSNVIASQPCPMNNRCLYTVSCQPCSAQTLLFIDAVQTPQTYSNGTMTYSAKLTAGTHSLMAVNLQ